MARFLLMPFSPRQASRSAQHDAPIRRCIASIPRSRGGDGMSGNDVLEKAKRHRAQLLVDLNRVETFIRDFEAFADGVMPFVAPVAKVRGRPAIIFAEIFKFLSEQNKPVTSHEILDHLIKTGVDVSCAKPLTNITVILWRNRNAVEKTKRGYTLKNCSNSLPAPPPVMQRKAASLASHGDAATPITRHEGIAS